MRSARMLGLMLTAFVAAVPSAAVPPAELKLAAPGLAVNGMDATLSAPLTDQLAKPFAPIRVITPRDIAALLGLERQKEFLGCGGTGECMAELGNALGVQGVLLGDVVKLGGAIQVNVHIIDPAAGKQLALASARVSSDAELFDALTRLGVDLRQQFYASLGVEAPPVLVEDGPPPEPKSKGTRRFFPIPLALGGASLVTGIVFFGLSESSYQQLTRGMPGMFSLSSAEVIAGTGSAFQTAGAVLVAVGAVALVAGLALLLFGSRP